MENIEEKVIKFSSYQCELGEGPLWFEKRSSLFWLDIIQKKVFEKKVASKEKEYDNCWQLSEIGSALALDGASSDTILIITDKSFGRLCLNTGHYTQHLDLNLNNKMRANDGSVGPDGNFWFGTMEKSPTGNNGSIYSITPNGELIKRIDGIGIPNTFCWSLNAKRLMLSDSLNQQMCLFDINSNNDISHSNKTIFVNLKKTSATPDGGALDESGNIWNAQWDGFKVQCYNPDGEELGVIMLPVPKVTSCCFGGPTMSHLFITTAKEGMSINEQKKYPLSGCTFVVKLQLFGLSVPPFKWIYK